ncbi:MAG: hypothetical protein J6B37_03285 [Clostridia bacterium]|nr:hypothetical protein [Clostridia bacterium]
MSNKDKRILELNDTVRENLKKMYIILLGLQIVKLILWFMETFISKVSVEQMDYEYSRNHSFYSGYSGGPIINIIAIFVSILSILLCVYAIGKKCFDNRLFAKILKPIMLISCVHYAFYLSLSIAETMTNSNNLTSAYGEGMAKVYSGPNFFGIIQFMAILVSTVITYNISSKTKAIANWKKEQEKLTTI